MLTTKVLLNKVRQKKDGTYPLVIRITYDRKTTYLPLGINMTDKDFDAKNQRIKSTNEITSNVTRLNNAIQEKIKKVYDTVTLLEQEGRAEGISMPALKKEIQGKGRQDIDFFAFTDHVISDLKKARKFGNAGVYRDLRNWIVRSYGEKPLPFRQIDYTFLKKLETKHYAAGNTAGGLSVSMRTLRAVYKRAIKSGIINEKYNPFKDYAIKSGTPKRMFLNEEQLNILKTAEFKENVLTKARDLYLVSFYLRGMNWMDMSLLKGGDIQGDLDRITYIRAKTRNKLFSIKIVPALKELLKKYNKVDFDKDSFVLPILPNKKMSPNQLYEAVKNKRKRQNGYLKRISKVLDLPHFTIYSARHTYANILKRSGAPSNIIQDSLGHTTEAMTQAYLNSFETSIIDEFDSKIM